MSARSGISIHSLPPLETGGSAARRGFALQDHVAAGFCIDMLFSATLVQVWCENLDDITLICKGPEDQERVEFVQVKGEEPDQLWSLAKLCRRKPSSDGPVAGTSILERSLQYDRCSEPCSFRIVTSRQVGSELEPLTYPIGSPQRQDEQGAKSVAALAAACSEKIADYRSTNNNGCDFWVENAFWQPVHSKESVQDRSKLGLRKFLEQSDKLLFSDQLDELYKQVLFRVQKAAEASWRREPEGKKIAREQFRGWVLATAAQMLAPPDEGGRAMRRKMEAARIPDDQIKTANEQRIGYRTYTLSERYLDLEDRAFIEREAAATLHSLRSDLDSEGLTDSGVMFHNRCLKSLDEVARSSSAEPRPPRHFLYGYMYYVTDRCLHRFLRTSS